MTTPLNTLDAVAVRRCCSGHARSRTEVCPHAGGRCVASAGRVALCRQLSARAAASVRAPRCVAFVAAAPRGLTRAAPGAVVGRHPAVEVLPFVAADAVSAALLYRMTKAYASSKAGATEGGSSWGCVLLFLWNPCAIATCIGCAHWGICWGFSLATHLDEWRYRRRNWSSLETVFVLTGTPLVAAAACVS